MRKIVKEKASASPNIASKLHQAGQDRPSVIYPNDARRSEEFT
jgi:hypothetical protein